MFFAALADALCFEIQNLKYAYPHSPDKPFKKTVAVTRTRTAFRSRKNRLRHRHIPHRKPENHAEVVADGVSVSVNGCHSRIALACIMHIVRALKPYVMVKEKRRVYRFVVAGEKPLAFIRSR